MISSSSNSSAISTLSSSSNLSEYVLCSVQAESTSTSLLFQLAHILLFIAYLSPNGKHCVLLMHSILAFAHLVLIVWFWGISCLRTLFPTLLGWSIAYLVVNLLRVGYQLYLAIVHVRINKDLGPVYEQLYAPIAVPRRAFQKLVSRGRMMTLQTGEAYAMESLTPTDRLALLITGKINVMSGNQFLHSISPCEFLDSPEWESGATSSSSSSGANSSTVTCNGSKSGESSFPSGNLNNSFGGSNNSTRSSQSGYQNFNGLGGNSSRGKANQKAPPQQHFNISLIASAPSQYIFWERSSLEYYLSKDNYMSAVMSVILARDITNKLYQINDKISSEKGSQIDIRLPVLITSFTRHLDQAGLASLMGVGGKQSGKRPISHQHHHHNPPSHQMSSAISTLATVSTSRSFEQHVGEGSRMRPASSSNLKPRNHMLSNQHSGKIAHAQQHRYITGSTDGSTNGDSANEIFVVDCARRQQEEEDDYDEDDDDELLHNCGSRTIDTVDSSVQATIDSNSEHSDSMRLDEEEEEEAISTASIAAISFQSDQVNYSSSNSSNNRRFSRTTTADTSVNIPLLQKNSSN